MATARRSPRLIRIGAVIRDKRERRGEIRRVVADRAGIHPVTLKKIELGRQAASRLLYLKIAGSLEMSVEEMDDLTGQKVDVA